MHVIYAASPRSTDCGIYDQKIVDFIYIYIYFTVTCILLLLCVILRFVFIPYSSKFSLLQEMLGIRITNRKK